VTFLYFINKIVVEIINSLIAMLKKKTLKKTIPEKIKRNNVLHN